MACTSVGTQQQVGKIGNTCPEELSVFLKLQSELVNVTEEQDGDRERVCKTEGREGQRGIGHTQDVPTACGRRLPKATAGLWWETPHFSQPERRDSSYSAMPCCSDE